MIEFTTIVAVDQEHLEELRVSWPTWRANSRPITYSPLIVLCDSENVRDQLDFIDIEFEPLLVSDVLPVSFPPGHHITQRERMLTALTYAAKVVSTDWFLKLDTDSIAFGGDDSLLDTDWDEDDSPPDVVAPRWGYTKPGHWIDELDRWADLVAPHNAKPFRRMSGGVAKSSRIISYAMLGRTEFVRQCLAKVNGNGRLPVPSQDTFTWYAAELFQRRIKRLNPHTIRWKHAGGRLHKLRTLAAEALA